MIKKRIMVILTVSMFLVSLLPAMNAEKQDDISEGIENFVPNELIVKFKEGVSDNDAAFIAKSNGLSVISKSQYSGVHKLKIPNGKTVIEFTKILCNNPNVEYAEPNLIYQTSMVPNDTYYSYQWHLHDINEGGINMEPAWDLSTGSGTVVAIIDTGISTAGNDLTDSNIVSGWDFVNGDSDPTDDNGHGTHCAGTVAQSTDNNIGACGVAYDANLMPVKVLDSGGSGSIYDVADGIIWATDNGANIISLSLGGGAHSTLEDAVAYAYNNGVTCFAASGNGGFDGQGDNGVDYPAAYDAYVIAVGATTYLKEKAYYSNYGNSLDIVAPGGDITVDENGDGYADGILQETFDPDWGYYFWQGTSMATPHAAGTAALLYSQGITAPDDIRNTLQSSTVDLGDPGFDIYFGHGLINAYNALTYNGNIPPTCTLTANPTSGEAPLTTTFSMTASDSDGTIASWELDVDNDGTAEYTGPGNPPATQSHEYTNVGVYTAELTVWDDASDTGIDAETVTATEPNYPPAAPSSLAVQHYGSVSVQDFSSSFSPTYSGTIVNGHTATHISDNYYHEISEDNRIQGGSGKAGLDVTYNIPISGSNAPYMLSIESYYSDSGDSYTVSYTVNGGGGESNIINIPASEGTLNYQITGVSAGDTVNVNIKDTSQAPNENVGTVYIDHIYIESAGSGGGTDDNQLTWIASTDDGAGADDVTIYNVYRSEDTISWSNTGIVTADNSATYSYIDSGAGTADATQWYYTVRAEDSGNLESVDSNSAQEPGTQNDPPYTPSNPNPADTAIDVNVNADLFWTGGDPNGNIAEYDVYFGTSSTPSKVATVYTETYDPGTLSYEITYYWKIVSRDSYGLEATGPVWSFTTETQPVNNPPDAPSNPDPADGATGISTSPTLSVSVYDTDGDSMAVTFYDASDGSIIGNTQTGIASGSTASVTWAGLSHSNTYSWYAVADDGISSTQSSIWSFTTMDQPTSASYVYDISWKKTGPHLKSIITIRYDSNNNGIAESSDALLPNAEVYYTMTHASGSRDYIGTTDSNGIVEFQWKQAPTGNYDGLVTNIIHSTYQYSSGLDIGNPSSFTN